MIIIEFKSTPQSLIVRLGDELPARLTGIISAIYADGPELTAIRDLLPEPSPEVPARFRQEHESDCLIILNRDAIDQIVNRLLFHGVNKER